MGAGICRDLAIQLKGEILKTPIAFDLEHHRITWLHAVERGLQRIDEGDRNSVHSVDDVAGLKINELRLPSGRFGGDDEPVFAPQTGDHGSEILIELDAKN